MNNLIKKVKEQTWLFTEEQIRNKIIDMQAHHEDYFAINDEYITLYLYKDKKTLTKEEFIKEIREYLYIKCFDTKERIDKELQSKSNYMDIYYNEVINGKNDYYHAVQKGRNHLLYFLTY